MSKINIGDKFHKLTVTSEPFRKPDAGKRDNQKYVLATCECGTKDKRYSIYPLLKGLYKSCGCYRKTWAAEKVYKHGLSKHPLWGVWQGMKRRCYNKSNQDYRNYGQRGITICDEWRNNFQIFYDWCINNGWRIGLVIDRENNDGNYEPSNCRFIDDDLSAQNRRSTKLSIEKVEEIRKIYAEPNPPTYTEVGKLYKVSRYMISDIVHGKAWKNNLVV